MRDGAKPLAIETLVELGQAVSTHASMGPFIFEIHEDETIIIEADGFNLVNTANKEQTSSKGVMSFGKITTSFPDNQAKFLITGGKVQMDTAGMSGLHGLSGTGEVKLESLGFENADINVEISEVFYGFDSRIQNKKTHRDDKMAFTGVTFNSPLPNGEDVKNWHLNMAFNTSGFAVEDMERLSDKFSEMDQMTSLLLDEAGNFDSEQYEQVMAEYFSTFMDGVKKDLSVSLKIDAGPENNDANIDLKLVYDEDLPLPKLDTIGQLIDALKFDGSAVVPAALVENYPAAMEALQQFSMMGLVNIEKGKFSSQFNLTEGKAKLNGQDYPIEMWVAALRDQPLDFSLLQ